MSYGRILKPRFYIDTPNWYMSRGVASSEFSVQATNTGNNFVGPDAGFVDADLFNMKPNQQVVFSTSDDSTSRADHVLIVIDKQTTNFPTDFVAILNHNMFSADAMFRVASSASDITAIDPTALASTEVLNADDTSDIFTPDYDGDSIITINTPTDNRYVAIQIEGESAAFDSTHDLKIGCVMIGELYTMPHSPDLSVKKSITFDGNKIQESAGGNLYSNAQWLEGNQSSTTQAGQPFRNQSAVTYGRTGGRMSYDMNFSYVNDTDLVPANIGSTHFGTANDFVVTDVWNRTGGSHIPFIFTPDSTADKSGDYLFARFNQDSFSMNQVANNIWNVGLSLRETW